MNKKELCQESEHELKGKIDFLTQQVKDLTEECDSYKEKIEHLEDKAYETTYMDDAVAFGYYRDGFKESFGFIATAMAKITNLLLNNKDQVQINVYKTALRAMSDASISIANMQRMWDERSSKNWDRWEKCQSENEAKWEARKKDNTNH